MTKYSFFFLLLLLQGCQLKPLMTSDKAIKTANCQIKQQELYLLQATEKRFLNAPTLRSKLLQTAIKDNNRAMTALLMSTPYSSTEQLQQAKRHFSKLRLNLQQACPGDQYIHLRDQYTTALLWLRAEQDNLQSKNQLLQIKIDALTQIESDLNQQREGQQ